LLNALEENYIGSNPVFYLPDCVPYDLR